MDAMTRIDQALNQSIEQALTTAVEHAQSPGCPAKLAAAMRDAVFPGGARLRPRLCLAVACSIGDDDPAIADAAAASIELLHCASLVHDDLPCFDNAHLRRGKASIHSAFGERIAVLTGDALIVLAFQTLARGSACSPQRLAPLMMIVSKAVGMPSGIVAGQGWECEPVVDLERYHLEKTGALFTAATMAGAAAAGAEPAQWRMLGERIGLAFQVADDIHDVVSSSEDIGKPVGRDLALGRPSAARDLGIPGAMERLEKLISQAEDSIPDCAGANGLRTLIRIEAQRFLPASLAQMAA